jgi:mannose-1-phosphate guanylyltransferase/phosphomannomutase
VRLAHERLTEPFLVISGDALCDVDLTELIETHKAKGAAVTIGLKSVDNPLEFGIVVTDDDGRVERFLEKPSWGQVFSDTINTGIYVLEPEVLRHVPDDRPYDFSKELFPLLLEMGRPIYGHVLDGYWQDIGNLDQFRQANFDALDGKVRLDVPGLRLKGNLWVSEGVDIDELEPVEGPAFIGTNCRIANGASIGAYTVLSQGVIVREGARVTRSVIDAGTYIGRAAVVEGAIVGRRCDLRDHVRVHEGVAIGDQVTVGPEASIYPGVRVYPYKEIETGAQIHESIVWETRGSTHVFGRDGAMGLVNVDLTPETAVRLAAALGTALRRGSRVVASRASPDACRMIQRAIIAGLTSTGVDVADLRISPAPVTRHVLKTQGLAAGVHVGVSSLDPEAVQIRVFEWPGNQMTDGLQREVEKYFTRQEIRRATFGEVGDTTYPARVRESYAQDIVDAVDVERVRRRRFRVAIDYGYSGATFTLPLVLGPLGVDAIGIRNSVLEDAVGDELDPLNVRRIVTGVGAELGVVFDRAAERLQLVDERGEPVSANVGMLLVAELLARSGRAGQIAVPVTATGLVEKVVEGSSLSVVRTPHSVSELTRAATQEGVVLAAAPTGGFVFPDVVPGYDAVTALAKILELLAPEGGAALDPRRRPAAPDDPPPIVRCPWGGRGSSCGSSTSNSRRASST